MRSIDKEPHRHIWENVFVNGYLTTPGQPAPEVWSMIEDLGFKIEVDYQQPVAR